VRNIDEMRALLQETNIDVLCISESWFKKHHSDKSVSITGYKLMRADRRDERRGGGTAMYVRSKLRTRFGFGWLLKVMFL
jgi:exonuclease III